MRELIVQRAGRGFSSTCTFTVQPDLADCNFMVICRASEMMQSKPEKVVLLDAEGVGLLVPSATGIIYEVQTGGYTCLRDRLEGFYVPLLYQVVDHYPELHAHFVEKWNGMCFERIDDETAAFIDATLARFPGHQGILVDRSRLSMSHESWIHVVITNPTLELLFVGFEDRLAAVLTWPNSD